MISSATVGLRIAFGFFVSVVAGDLVYKLYHREVLLADLSEASQGYGREGNVLSGSRLGSND